MKGGTAVAGNAQPPPKVVIDPKAPIGLGTAVLECPHCRHLILILQQTLAAIEE